MEASIVSMAEKSLRTLCFAYKKLRAADDIESKDEKGVFDVEKQNLVCLALLGVKDIPR
jgi:magnesium-transporting ATPase (P-type)